MAEQTRGRRESTGTKREEKQQEGQLDGHGDSRTAVSLQGSKPPKTAFLNKLDFLLESGMGRLDGCPETRTLLSRAAPAGQ